MNGPGQRIPKGGTLAGALDCLQPPPAGDGERNLSNSDSSWFSCAVAEGTYGQCETASIRNLMLRGSQELKL